METMRGRKRATLVLGVMLVGLLAVSFPAYAAQICFNNMAGYVARASVTMKDWQGWSSTWSSGSLSYGQTKCATAPLGKAPIISFQAEYLDINGWNPLCHDGPIYSGLNDIYTANLKGTTLRAWCDRY